MTPRIRGNDYSALTPPRIGSWTPSMRVSVVIPAYNNQAKLDLTLAGLAGQTYPAELLEVIVVDNGSDPRLTLPELRPAGTRLIQCDTPGRANARNAGLAASTGDVIHWLDSDVVLDRESIEAHMRWHHLAPYLVVTGYLRFSSAELPSPDVVAGADDLTKLFEPSEPHEWIVDLVERTGGLRQQAHRTFSLHIGGATSVNARLLDVAGPMDDKLFLGQDTEMGYRLAQAGAAFIPEPLARGYHLGPTMRMRDKEPITRVSHAFIADRIPQYRWLRSHPGRQWLVPYVELVVDADGASYEDVRATVDAALAGTLPDVGVVITGPWDTLTPERRAPLTDPRLDLALIHGHYLHEGRVRLAREAGPTKAPFRLRVPAGWVPGEDTIARLVDLAVDDGYGLISVLLAERPVELGRVESALGRTGGTGANVTNGTNNATGTNNANGANGVESDAGRGIVSARLERTAAFARAEIAREEDEDVVDVVEDTFGTIWVDGETYGFLPAADAPKIRGRRSTYRALQDAEAEVARLTKEVERLKGQVGKWREEAARWRKNAVEFRREIGALRKELGALRKSGGFRSAVKRLPLAAYAKRAVTRKPKT
ncbi:glycosyltransferase [Thermopolyspora sp. NPDC052614]|uniref:glycosyltransferase family 2 protein n=1 Tax=Thermopolyspora sp. NPDC052614 TaxID=3155682 RepID=UPI00341299D5